MDKDIIDFLKSNKKEDASELAEAFRLVNIILEDTLENISKDIEGYLNLRDYSNVNKLTMIHEKIDDISEDYLNQADNLKSEDEELAIEIKEDDMVEKPDYDKYRVNNNIAYTLYNNWTHKRPYGFVIEGKEYKSETWKEILLNTCEYLYIKDSVIFKSFINDKKMQGKRRKQFSFDKKEIMRKPIEIGKTGIYIESNLSANGIKNIIIKMLRKYNIRMSEYLIYLRADYTDLHRE